MRPIFPPLLILATLIAGCPKDSYGGGCNLFSRHSYSHAVVQQVVAHHQPYYAQPLYFAGVAIEQEAAFTKALANERPKLVAEVVKQLTQQQAHTQQSTAAPTKPAASVATGVFSSCTSCHTGANAAGGLVLDGVTPIDCNALFRWAEMAGVEANQPQEMKAVISGLTTEQKGAILNAMTQLVRKGKEQPAAEGDLE